MIENKIIILVQSLEQPRVIKRIIEKAAVYENVIIYAFDRGIHKVNNYDVLKNYENVTIKKIGGLSNGKYLNRLALYFKLLYKIYKNHGVNSKNIYVFGIDLRLITSFIINTKVEYEISDIFWLYKSGFQKKILKFLDERLVNKSDKVIFTSQGFYNKYYMNHISFEKIEIKENKFKTYDKVHPILKIKEDKLRIAYIGAFRYQSIVENLISVVKDEPEIILNFYGDGNSLVVNLMKESADNYNNINFHGAFKNPDSLENIYFENNLNFVVYDNKLDNEKVAMPNKFYESGFFNIPIVCAKNTYVGERVIENEMGWIIDTSYQSIKTFLKNIEMTEIIKYHEKIKKLNKSLFQI